jgi:hypothetical protein
MDSTINSTAVEQICALVRKSDYDGIRSFLEANSNRDLLTECAEQFRFYETSHRAKNTEESTVKAEVNAALATKIEARLAA